ncbi:MAG: pyridoxal phosphate-dependent aminotransferase, partial [Phycisphaerales bacterium]
MPVTSALTLSDRVARLAGSSTLAITAKVKELRAAGEDVIGFGAGEPDFDTPDFIKEAAIEALRAGKTRYAPVAGEPAARAAIASKLRDENRIQCASDDIIINVGGKHSIYLALHCLLDPGKEQEVVLPTPAWVSYRPIIELAGGIVKELPGAVENDFKITADQLEAAITDRTRLLIINSPSNPCGTMYTPDELRELAAVLERHPHLVILTDEMYEKLIYGGIEHLSLGSLDSIADRVITIGGLSKAYAMTGWRIGYTCAPGDDGTFIKAMTRLQSQMTSNITSFCYSAIVEALTNGGEAVETMRQTFAQRAELIHTRLSAIDGVVCPRPTGAFYAFPDISAYFGRTSPKGAQVHSAVDFATALLDEARVAVVPGDDFGEIGRNHVRFSFACANDLIETGM